MTESMQYVTYYVVQQIKSGFKPSFEIESEAKDFEKSKNSHPAIQEFMLQYPAAVVIDSFIESPENKRAARWPELQKAIECCKQRNAKLLIIELGNLTSSETFTHALLSASVPFHCIDQPFVNPTILEALSKHAEVQRKLHGELIRKGLKMTSAKSGNPNAAEVISKVNKPKIDTAIVFAFLLQPIIEDYRRKGHSQRQMVKSLNEEGFTAPEGGKWVLSQLQKVLDRVRLNEMATELKPVIDDFHAMGYTTQQMAESLNSQAKPAIKSTPWDEPQVKKLQDRIQQIQEIVLINRFVLDLLPILHNFRKQGFSSTEMLREFELIGMPIRNVSAMA